MKVAALQAFALLAVVSGVQVVTTGTKQSLAGDDRTMTKVVKMLQGLLDASKAEGEQERELYGKFKCYCDQNEEAKTYTIERLTAEIEYLESDIAKLQAENGVHSKKAAELQSSLEANAAAVQEANDVRSKNLAAWEAFRDDMVAALAQLKEAIDVLTEVGADQTLQSARDHERFMAGYGTSLAKLRTRVSKALMAASAFVPKEQRGQLQAFIQKPFTANYAATSGEVVGILKNMRDTFTANLNDANRTEIKEVEAHAAFLEIKSKEAADLQTAYNGRQASLSANSNDISTKKGELKTANEDKASAEAFLAQLRPMCSEKAKEYDHRKMMRANEQAALSEAIAILNSDAAFATFGKVDATRSGPLGEEDFLQLRSSHKAASPSRKLRLQVEELLQTASKGYASKKLNRVAAALHSGNPFDVVLEEINKMIALLADEGEQDKAKFEWCKTERTRTNADIAVKEQEILGLTGRIDGLNIDISELKNSIKGDESSLSQSLEDQESETKMRKEEKEAYEADVANLVEAQTLLKKAITVLDKYYADVLARMEGTGDKSLLQESPTPPQPWEGEYQGQAQQGMGVIQMLQYILSETVKEEKDAHDYEAGQQHDYEDSMEALKSQQKSLEASLVRLRKELADQQKELRKTTQERKATVAAKEALSQYLEKIRPGCDFITTYKATRDSHRAAEKAALTGAKDLIMQSAAYVNALEAAHIAKLGECKGVCLGREEQAQCKACLSDVTVPGYCAGHAGSPGCDES